MQGVFAFAGKRPAPSRQWRFRYRRPMPGACRRRPGFDGRSRTRVESGGRLHIRVASSGCQSYKDVAQVIARACVAGLAWMARRSTSMASFWNGEDIVRRHRRGPPIILRGFLGVPQLPGKSNPSSSKSWMDAGFVRGRRDGFEKHVGAVLPKSLVEILRGGLCAVAG